MRQPRSEEFSGEEAQQRFQKLVRSALNTKPTPAQGHAAKERAGAVEETLFG
jgi:hypothetical protein